MKRLLFALFMVPALAFAAEEIPSLDQMINSLIELIKNIKTMPGVAIASAIISIIVMFLKSNYCGNWFGNRSAIVKRLIIVVLGQASAIILMIMDGATFVNSIYLGLVASGGAILIFECVISLWPDFKAFGLSLINLLSIFKKKE